MSEEFESIREEVCGLVIRIKSNKSNYFKEYVFDKSILQNELLTTNVNTVNSKLVKMDKEKFEELLKKKLHKGYAENFLISTNK